jgi:hypothetical protein
VERPAVKQGFGEFYFVVAETLKNMDAEMERLIQEAAPSANVPDLRQRVGAWAEAHPIQAGLTGRQSADPDMIRKVGEIDLGTMASLKSLGEAWASYSALDSYNVYLPKQARWAELLLSDIARGPQVDALISNVMVLSNALAKTSSSMERMPETMGQAREAIRADVDGERLAAQAFLQDELLQTLYAVRQERIATIAAMHNERLAATADLRGERQAVLDSLYKEEAAVMNDVNAQREKTLKDLDSRGRGLIDHFFLRALELVLLTLVLCSLLSWILLRRARPRRATPRDQLLSADGEKVDNSSRDRQPGQQFAAEKSELLTKM